MQEKLEKCFCLYLYEKTEGNKGFFFFNEGTIPNKKASRFFLNVTGHLNMGVKGSLGSGRLCRFLLEVTKLYRF